MKALRYAAIALLALGSASLAAPKKAPTANLGNVLYIGDSITHGFGAPSYRWALHKIFVDNGISYNEIGVQSGNRNNGVPENTIYLGQPFKNLHAAMSSERAYEVSNRGPNDPKRLDGSSLFHWLGLDKDAEGKEVKPIEKRSLDAKPDTCFILLGTNDTLSDYGDKGGIAKNISAAEKALLDKKKGDMSVIVNTLRKVNPSVKIVLLTIPTWSEMKKNNKPEDYKAIVRTYNSKLSKAFKKETVVDVNEGLVDICDDVPYRGVATFFNAGDKLHPSLQGDMIMAGLVARAMGYAGRTAGLERKAASAFSSSAAALLERAGTKENVESAGAGLSLKAGAKLVAPWQEGAEKSKGFAADVVMSVGNGPAGGWDKTPAVAISLGNGKHSGTLKLAEGYIIWNTDTILYPVNLAKNTEPIRVAWVPGNASQRVGKGFYVWYGDMLVGEALPDDGQGLDGVSIENTSGSGESIKSFAVDDVPSAPVTKRFVKEQARVLFDEEKPAEEGKKK